MIHSLLFSTVFPHIPLSHRNLHKRASSRGNKFDQFETFNTMRRMSSIRVPTFLSIIWTTVTKLEPVKLSAQLRLWQTSIHLAANAVTAVPYLSERGDASTLLRAW